MRQGGGKKAAFPFLSFPRFPVTRNHLFQLGRWKVGPVPCKEKIPLQCRGMDVAGAELDSPLTLSLCWEEGRDAKRKEPSLAFDDKSCSLTQHCWGASCSYSASKQVRSASQNLFSSAIFTEMDLYKHGC